MIRIHHQRECIVISGHADYAEHGSDIVCAGVSSLAQTLVHVLERDYNIIINTKSGYINIVFSKKLDEKGMYFIKGIMYGLKTIASTYPDYVSYTENLMPY